MEKLAPVAMIVVIGLQAIHFANASTGLDYFKYVDDQLQLSYTAWNSNALAASYAVSFYVVASALTALFYAVLLIAKIANISLNPKLQEILHCGSALLQFSFGVIIAITSSTLTDPNGKNGAAYSPINKYTTYYAVGLADNVLTWVLCVPITFGLAVLNSGGKTEGKVEGGSELAIRTV